MNIYVGNLLFDVGESEIREAFEKFGKVTEVRLIMHKSTDKSKGFGFVEMPSEDEAEKAIKEMDGKEFMGRAMNVSKTKPKSNNRFGGGRRGGSNRY